MKILFVAPSAYPLGGIADWLDSTLDGLSGLNHLCGVGLVEGGGHNAKAYLDRHPWSSAVVISNPSGSREGRIRSLMKSIEGSRSDLLVSVNLVDTYEAVRRLRHAFPQNVPRLAIALHGLQVELLADIRINRDVIDGVVATNRLAAAVAGAAMDDSARSHYAPCGVITRTGVHEAFPGTVFRLLYAGRIEQEQKRVMDLPPILSSLLTSGLDARLGIAGGGPHELQLRKGLEEHRVADRVDWFGELDARQLAQVYRNHDAIIITSVWETGPIVAWEAMSHGLPVVSTRYVGSGCEGALIDGKTAVLFPIGNISGAVEAVHRLLDGPFRARIVAGALSLVKFRYSREFSALAWQGALKTVLDSPRKATDAPLLSAPAGRLDNWLGVERAEGMRRLLGIRFVPDSPGAAWPHTYSRSLQQQKFLNALREFDDPGFSAGDLNRMVQGFVDARVA